MHMCPGQVEGCCGSESWENWPQCWVLLHRDNALSSAARPPMHEGGASSRLAGPKEL